MSFLQRIFATVATVALLTTAIALTHRDPTRKLDLALREQLRGAPGDVIRVIVHAELDGFAAVRQRLETEHHAILSVDPSGQSITAAIAVSDLRSLAADARVRSVSLDAPVRSAGIEGGHGGSRNTLATLVNTLGVADSKFLGTNVGVAIVDSGFEPTAIKEDFAKNTLFFDFTAPTVSGAVCKDSKDFNVCYDNYGHGTHVAGLIGSSGAAAGGLYRGLAPGAHLIVLKALDQDGQGYTSTVINALNFAVAHKQELGIDVLNLSLGHPIYEPASSDPLVQAVERTVRAGIVVVVAAGNDGGDPVTHEVGYAGITSPGNAPSAITVGAFDMAGTVSRGDDTIPWYSSRGPTWYDGFQKPDLVAPGHHMVSDIDTTSTLYAAYPNLIISAADRKRGKDGGSGQFFQLSGTSMAAAVTTGTVALVIDASRRTFGLALPPNAIKGLLQYSALPLDGSDTLTQGAGALNAAGALALATLLDPTVPNGSWWLTTGITPSTTIAGTSLDWAQRVIWGDRVVWGDQLFSNQPAWASRVVWGDRVIWGDRVVWGESTVWGSQPTWAARVVWGDALLGMTDGSRVIWGDRVVWGDLNADRVVWGDLSESTLASLSAPGDPYGFATLHNRRPMPRATSVTRHKSHRVHAGGSE